MSIFFKPTGTLDVTTDSSDLPQESSQYNITTGALKRWKNLRLDESGVAKLRDGSKEEVDTSQTTVVWNL